MSSGSKQIRTIDWDRARRHRPFTKVAVLGAGTMGSQIAAHLANAGVSVLLLDIAPESTAPKDGDNPNAIVESGFKKMLRLRPNPLFTAAAANRIQLGNFDTHFEDLGGVDWVIEAVLERRDVKESVMQRLEQVTGSSTVISSNTSGIPIADLGKGRSDAFRARLLGTHFFNPPRYLPLLEIVPTPDTDWNVVERVASFSRIHLGKGVVLAKDSPYFIGNRVGIYSMLVAMREQTTGGYSIEEIDALSGTLVGRPKSATFRTADVVGLDVMKSVIDNLYEAVPDDESRELFKLPEFLNQLVEEGHLGSKTKAGFYQKVGRNILSFDMNTKSYQAAAELNLPSLGELKNQGGLTARLRSLFESDSRSGIFFRRTILETMAYAARRIPEIADSPADVDNAIRWGFGWRLGPFETWDVLGFENVVESMNKAQIGLPEWIQEMSGEGPTSFYDTSTEPLTVFVPAQRARIEAIVPNDEKPLSQLRAVPNRTIWESPDAALIDMGAGVVLYEFRSKANTLGAGVVNGLVEAVDRIEGDSDIRGMVIGNEGSNFSVGANLGEVAAALLEGKFSIIEEAVRKFQGAIQRVRYSVKPIAVAVHQRVLGGACELVLAAPTSVAAAESYIGLVELGVGLIPAGTGSTRLAALAASHAPNGFDNEIQASLARYFEQIAMARVSTSAREAQEMGYFPFHASIVMRPERRFEVAKQEVIRLSEKGYLPPFSGELITVLGSPGRAALEVMAYQFHQGKFITDYDFRLARDLATVLTGGDLPGSTSVDENYLLDLEREVFMSLLGEKKTQERIQNILEHNKPLRN
ncbi:MAG: 3-hydroxyacyl-CoA dehydrogenase/enoyl-CoA hydratase family protein [Rhodothermia bacterium]|nr:MAG: 3-hydroxyacyl-CoA dehydrogenase/enoyl-CoA hydratase family protein [Rhodothermia bacterium]